MQDIIQMGSVEKLIYCYFDALYRADIDTLQTLFHRSASICADLSGEIIIDTPEAFFADIGARPSMQRQNIDCRCAIAHLDVNGRVASATLRMDGFYGKAAVNEHFHLLREDQNWKIVCKSSTSLC